MNAIEFTNVSRSFGIAPDQALAVDRLSLSVPVGSVFGLLGANGAGKTTSIRMMIGHLKPDDGVVRVLGENPLAFSESLRSRIAYISENMQMPGWMTLPIASQYSAALYPKWDTALLEVLTERFRLNRKKRYDEMSKGQRRAMCIILALCQNAELLLLDEPASGLDTIARREFLSLMLEFVCDGSRTVLFSSHILSDIERIVDQVVILKNGKILLAGELDQLKEDKKLNLEDMFVASVNEET